MMKRALDYLAPLLVLAALNANQARAQEVLAVLSSDLAPYQEAWSGLQEALDGRVGRVELADYTDIGRDTRVVVAFGGKAAARTYPDRVTVIACLAPGGPSAPDDSRRNFIEISMVPTPAASLAQLLRVQPDLKRLAAPWVSASMAHHVRRLDRAAADIGLAVVSAQVRGAGELPARLRDLRDAEVDAVWLPPDPLLINKQNIMMLKEFCWANDIPLYVPTAGLVKQGAVGAVTASFRAMGRTAGQTARALLAGGRPQRVVSPQNAELILNPAAAIQSGIAIPTAALEEAAQVLP